MPSGNYLGDSNMSKNTPHSVSLCLSVSPSLSPENLVVFEKMYKYCSTTTACFFPFFFCLQGSQHHSQGSRRADHRLNLTVAFRVELTNAPPAPSHPSQHSVLHRREACMRLSLRQLPAHQWVEVGHSMAYAPRERTTNELLLLLGWPLIQTTVRVTAWVQRLQLGQRMSVFLKSILLSRTNQAVAARHRHPLTECNDLLPSTRTLSHSLRVDPATQAFQADYLILHWVVPAVHL